ncbi:DNRLRE domain-containing protein [Laceyella putida]|uniref:serine-type D-Ala-D-Ala carboxypeptidase n=1 Tax=Laceyella putida TaxID=110101 RepID=A0ABW2RJT4_9BACL
MGQPSFKRWMRWISIPLVMIMLAILFLPINPSIYAQSGAKAKKENGLKEVIGLRTEKSKTFVKSDGKTFVTEQYLEPIHYKESGKWINIKERNKSGLQAKRLSGGMTYVNLGHQTRFAFADKSTSPNLVRFEQGKAKIDFRLTGSHPVTVKRQVNGIVYPNVYEGIDLVYQVEATGVKEEWVLHKRTGPSTFSMALNTENTKPVLQKDGSIQFVAPNGKVIFVVPVPFMYDQNDAASHKVKFQLRQKGGVTYLDLKADEQWLKDPKRAYPVVIDPTVGLQGVKSTYDNFVSSKNPTQNYRLFPFVISGTHPDYGIARSFIKFDLPALPEGAQITNAQVYLQQYSTEQEQQIDLFQVTSDWTSSGVNWENQPSVGNVFSHAKVAGAGEYAWDLTGLAKGWYQGTEKNYGFSLRHHDEANDRKSFRSSDYLEDISKRPKLLITYRVEPSVPIAQPTIAAKSHILLDYQTGLPLYGNQTDQPLPPASMTKMMTEYIVLEEIHNNKLSWDDMVQVSARAAGIEEAQIDLQPGEQMTVKDLFMGMAVYSANDATVALAERVAGSETDFVHRMNATAQAMDLKNSHFRNATGLEMTDYPDPPQVGGEHLMSARDAAVLARKLLQTYPEFSQLISAPQYTFRPGTTREKKVVNWNRMLPGFDHFYPGVDGLKTGSTLAAGYCFTGTAKQEGHRLITVVMGTSSEDSRFVETKKLLDYGFNRYEMATLVKRGETIGGAVLRVPNGDGQSTPVYGKREIRIPIYRGERDQYTIKVRFYTGLKAPLKAGTTVGVAQVFYRGLPVRGLPMYPVAITKSVNEASQVQQFFRQVNEGFQQWIE